MAAPLDENILSLLPHPTFAHLVTVQASLVVQTVKNPPAVWEDWVQSLDPEDPLESEGNSNPLHCCCLGTPMDRGARKASVHGVAKELNMT